LLKLVGIHPQVLLYSSEINSQIIGDPSDRLELLVVEPVNGVVHNQTVECFVFLLCHNTFALKLWLKGEINLQKRCTLVTVSAALLLPISLYSCFHFCCTVISDFAVFLFTGYSYRLRIYDSKAKLVFGKQFEGIATIDLSAENLSRGLYILRVELPTEVISTKLIYLP
jgi:hypothetical protein